MATAMVPRMTMERLTVAVCVLAAVMTTATASAVQDPPWHPVVSGETPQQTLPPKLPTSRMVPVICEPCRPLTEQANDVARRMNELAEQYNSIEDAQFDLDLAIYGRRKALHLRWQELYRELEDLDGHCTACALEKCPKGSAWAVRIFEGPVVSGDTPTADSSITKPLVIAGAGVVLIGGAAALSGGKDAPAPGNSLPDLSSFLGNYTIDFRINGCGRVDNSQVNGTLTPNVFIKSGLPSPATSGWRGPTPGSRASTREPSTGSRTCPTTLASTGRSTCGSGPARFKAAAG